MQTTTVSSKPALTPLPPFVSEFYKYLDTIFTFANSIGAVAMGTPILRVFRTVSLTLVWLIIATIPLYCDQVPRRGWIPVNISCGFTTPCSTIEIRCPSIPMLEVPDLSLGRAYIKSR